MTRMMNNRSSEKLDVTVGRPIGAVIEMAFARRTPQHQGTHAHKARPYPSNASDRQPSPATDTFEEILIVNEERLDLSNFAAFVLIGEISVLESSQNRSSTIS